MSKKREILLREEMDNGFFHIVDSGFLSNIEKPDGNLLSEEWFYSVHDFYDGICIVTKLDGKQYYLREDGTFVSDVGYHSVNPFINGMGTVSNENHTWDWMLPSGELFFKKWVKKAYPVFCLPVLYVVFEDDSTARYDERTKEVEYR